MTRSIVDMLNRCLPVASYAKLGTLLANLVAQVNALQADMARLYLINQFVLIAPTLACTATTGHKGPKSTAAFAVWVGSTLQSCAANTDLSAMVGVVAAGKCALWAWYIDATGTITTSAKTADAADAAAALALKPSAPASKVELGYVTVANGSVAAWTAGTDALDAASITTTYHDNASITAMASMTAAPIAPLA